MELMALILCLFATAFGFSPYSAKHKAIRFMDNFNNKATDLCHWENVAMWNLFMNLTEHNQEVLAKALDDQKTFISKSATDVASYEWQSISNQVVRRQFEILDKEYKETLPPQKAKELQQLSDQLRGNFTMARVCPYNSDPSIVVDENNCQMSLDDMKSILETSSDNAELLHYWKQWREATGNKARRDTYLRFIELSNEEAQINGYSDVGEKWRSHYETEDFAGVLENILAQIRPLYQQLHAYIRRKLIGKYGEDKVRENGPLPGHLLGYETNKNWMNLERFARPYPNKPILDITPIMKERNLSAIDVVKMADDFFQSLGLAPMREEFWNNSVFTKLNDRIMVCHGQAFDFCDGKDYRIRMCIRNTMDDLRIIHHEMGHIQYCMLYAHLPYILRLGANDGFHEAIGDTISLSLFTTSHWKKLGFIENTADEDEEQEMNGLLRMGLDRLALIPYVVAMENWRWGLFDGSVHSDNANTKWWEYSLKYSGVCPPVKRTEEYMDALELFHVNFHVSVDRYLISDILQFQLHKVLCDVSGHVGPLHKCDIYGSKEAGKRLKDALSLGSSKPWPEVLKTLTAGSVDYMDVTPLLEYFQPLYEWLKEQNKGERIGWVSEDPTVCP